MDERLAVLKLDVESFQRWVQVGIIQVSKNLFATLPFEWPGPDDAPTGIEQLSFLVQLPEKYTWVASARASTFALVDEVKAISLPTEALTLEWGTRMRNLGEGWLPFEFKPEWVHTRPAEKAEVEDDGTSSEPPRPVTDESTPQETIPRESELTIQDEHVTERDIDMDSEPAAEMEADVEDIVETDKQAMELEGPEHTAMPGLGAEDNESQPPEEDEAAEAYLPRKENGPPATTNQEKDTDEG